MPADLEFLEEIFQSLSSSDIDWAIARLHESQNYTPHEPGTGPGYLRQPLIESEEQYREDVAATLKDIFS